MIEKSHTDTLAQSVSMREALEPFAKYEMIAVGFNGCFSKEDLKDCTWVAGFKGPQPEFRHFQKARDALAAQPPAAPVETVTDEMVAISGLNKDWNAAMQRAIDAEADAQRLHKEKMDMYERAIAAEAKLAALSRSSAGNDGLAKRAAEMLSGGPMGFRIDGPLMQALATEIGGPFPDAGAANRTIREALELAAGAQQSAATEAVVDELAEFLCDEYEGEIGSFSSFNIGIKDRWRDLVRAMLARVPAEPQASGVWQPIETAPHEEQVLLGWWYIPPWKDQAPRWECEVGEASRGWTRNGISTMSRHGQATHWQPLPSPLTRPESK